MMQPIPPTVPDLSWRRSILCAFIIYWISNWLYKKLQEWPHQDYGYVGIAFVYLLVCAIVYHACWALGNRQVTQYYQDLKAYEQQAAEYDHFLARAKHIRAERDRVELEQIMQNLRDGRGSDEKDPVD